jgi:hypothetical protein
VTARTSHLALVHRDLFRGSLEVDGDLVANRTSASKILKPALNHYVKGFSHEQREVSSQ